MLLFAKSGRFNSAQACFIRSILTASVEHSNLKNGEADVRVEGNKTLGSPASSPVCWGERTEGWDDQWSGSFLRDQGRNTVGHSSLPKADLGDS